VIADAERQHSALNGHADGHSRLHGDEPLNRPQTSAGWDEAGEHRTCHGGNERKVEAVEAEAASRATRSPTLVNWTKPAIPA